MLEFVHPKTLQDIGFVKYNSDSLDSLRKLIPNTVFDSIAMLPRIKSFEKVWSFSKGIENNYFEHLMIENNISCKRDDETCLTLPVITIKDIGKN
jgi:hypothetical protein